MNFWDEFVYAVGVDPGLTKTGLVVLNEHGLAHSATFTAPADDDLGKRLSSITRSLIFKAWALCLPAGNRTLFSIEANYVASGRSAQSALKQRELIGCLRMAAEDNHFGHPLFYEVAPASGKKALAGSGKADKDQMVEAMLAYPGSPLGRTKASREAVADALGAALAGIAQWEKDNQ